MIVTSLVLVVISAVSLLVGGLFSDGLDLIYVSIAAALLAGGFLAVAWVQGGRRRKPVRAATLPGEDAAGRPATWQGASWTGAATVEDAPLSRDDQPAVPVSAVADTQSLAPVAPPSAPDDAVFAPPVAPVAPAPALPASWAPPPPPPGAAAPAPGATGTPQGGATPPPPPPPA